MRFLRVRLAETRSQFGIEIHYQLAIRRIWHFSQKTNSIRPLDQSIRLYAYW